MRMGTIMANMGSDFGELCGKCLSFYHWAESLFLSPILPAGSCMKAERARQHKQNSRGGKAERAVGHSRHVHGAIHPALRWVGLGTGCKARLPHCPPLERSDSLGSHIKVTGLPALLCQPPESPPLQAALPPA